MVKSFVRRDNLPTILHYDKNVNLLRIICETFRYTHANRSTRHNPKVGNLISVTRTKTSVILTKYTSIIN